jgi:hypothetical protein
MATLTRTPSGRTRKVREVNVEEGRNRRRNQIEDRRENQRAYREQIVGKRTGALADFQAQALPSTAWGLTKRTGHYMYKNHKFGTFLLSALVLGGPLTVVMFPAVMIFAGVKGVYDKRRGTFAPMLSRIFTEENNAAVQRKAEKRSFAAAKETAREQGNPFPSRFQRAKDSVSEFWKGTPALRDGEQLPRSEIRGQHIHDNSLLLRPKAAVARVKVADRKAKIEAASDRLAKKTLSAAREGGQNLESAQTNAIAAIADKKNFVLSNDARSLASRPDLLQLAGVADPNKAPQEQLKELFDKANAKATTAAQRKSLAETAIAIEMAQDKNSTPAERLTALAGAVRGIQHLDGKRTQLPDSEKLKAFFSPGAGESANAFSTAFRLGFASLGVKLGQTLADGSTRGYGPSGMGQRMRDVGQTLARTRAPDSVSRSSSSSLAP